MLLVGGLQEVYLDLLLLAGHTGLTVSSDSL